MIYKSYIAHNKKYTIMNVVSGPEGNAGFISSTVFLPALPFRREHRGSRGMSNLMG